MSAGVFAPVILCLLGSVAKGAGDEPQKVTACEVKKDPAAYNHKLLEVTGIISRGFEDFTFSDPTCASWPPFWLEYGGTISSQTIYCCPGSPDRTRPVPLVVEDISIPLTDDQKFREFDRLLQDQPNARVRATVIGRFFAGRQEQSVNGVVFAGYGHLGCCSLLVIQQVLSVEVPTRR